MALAGGGCPELIFVGVGVNHNMSNYLLKSYATKSVFAAALSPMRSCSNRSMLTIYNGYMETLD